MNYLHVTLIDSIWHCNCVCIGIFILCKGKAVLSHEKNYLHLLCSFLYIDGGKCVGNSNHFHGFWHGG